MPKISGSHTRKFGGRNYHLYTSFDTKRAATAEANRLKRAGNGRIWLVRVVHSQYGYDLWTTQRGLR